MERLLLFVALLTGIALVSLDWSWMQFLTAGLHMSRQALELLCRLAELSVYLNEMKQEEEDGTRKKPRHHMWVLSHHDIN